jgi:cell division protein FtsI/penicillin-binding protein 2
MRIETKIQKFINKLNTINRVYIVAGFFILFGLFIITKIFQYTVFDKEFYTKLADRQQI